MKGCGKSAPGPWQQGSHGKPHPEQDRIGAARFGFRRKLEPGQACFAPDRPGWSLEPCGNARPRGMAAPADTVPDGIPSAGQNPAYRLPGASELLELHSCD